MGDRVVLLSLLVIGISALGGLFWVLVISPPSVITEQAVPVSAAPAGDPVFKDVETNESSSLYEISVKYPEFSGLRNKETARSINTLIREEVGRQIREFKNMAVSAGSEASEYKSTLKIDYNTANMNPDFVALELNNYSYIAGAAHGLGVIHSFNYNLKDNRELKLADMFGPGSDYLSVLSGQSRKILREKLGDSYEESFVIPGTEPEGDNYEVYVFMEDRIVVTFNAYQVAPYAAGPQSVEIDYGEMADIINPEIAGIVSAGN